MTLEYFSRQQWHGAVGWGQRSNWSLGHHSWEYSTPSWPRPCFSWREASWPLHTWLAGSGLWAPSLPNSAFSARALTLHIIYVATFSIFPRCYVTSNVLNAWKLIYDIQWMPWGALGLNSHSAPVKKGWNRHFASTENRPLVWTEKPFSLFSAKTHPLQSLA